LPGKYGVNVTFNIFDLTMFDVGDEDSRSNPFKEKESVGFLNIINTSETMKQNYLEVHRIPLDRSRVV
jgi:hypothetical protein